MKTKLKVLTTALLLCVSEAGHAGPVGPLTTFTAGTQAKAAEVNGNFNAVRTAVDDNAGRIGALGRMTDSARRPVGGYLVILQMSAQHEKLCRTNVQTS